MKLGIFDPYLDTIGGGERYCLSIAEALLKKSWEVDVFWPDESIKDRLIEKFNLGIEKINFVNYFPNKVSLLDRRKFEKSYDALFWVSDGSLPLMFSKKNLLHFQVPFKNVLHPTLANKIKLNRIDRIICNSVFTKKVIDSCLGVSSLVLYPPVDVDSITPGKKENIIISVGRFSQLLQGKRQDILVEVFKKMIDNGLIKNWKLILAGGSEVGAKEFVEKIKAQSKGYPIEIIENPDFKELIKLYGKAKIFWNASGFGIDEEKEPEKVEHFGISTVEAMAAGCVPIVLGKGGQKEIIEQDKNGQQWQTKDELMEFTLILIESREVVKRLSENAILRSKQFSKEKFAQEIYSLFENEKK